MKTLFHDLTVVDVEKRRVLPHTDITVENGIITDISPSGAGEKKKADKIYKLSGRFASPGLINLHAHLFGTGRPSKALGAGKTQERLLKFIATPIGKRVMNAIVAFSAKTQLRSGVTTLRTSGDMVGSDLALKKKVSAGKGGARGLRLIVPGYALTVPGGHGDGTFAKTGRTPDELVKLVDEAAAAGADYIKICITGGVMDSKKRGEPGEVRMSAEEVKAVCDRAHELGKKVAAHAQSPEGVRIAALNGVDTIEHGAPADEESIAAIKARGGAMVVTYSPALPLAALSPEITKLGDTARYNSGVVLRGMTKGAHKFSAAGVKVGIGTDASCPFCTQYGTWREAVYFKNAMGVSREKALYTATLGNAEVLGLEKVTGSIAVGKSADFMLLKDNPLDDLSALAKPQKVVAGGRVVYSFWLMRIKKIEEILDKLTEDVQWAKIIY